MPHNKNVNGRHHIPTMRHALTNWNRLIQQALLQVLQPQIDFTFSVHSHGFRPAKRAHDAAKAARGYVEQGKRVVVDVDLSKFFDRVNYDI
jgi:RNA-directed DNA polymerase